MASAQQAQKFSFPALLINLLIPMSVGALGGLLTQKSVNTWYLTINKPSLHHQIGHFQQSGLLFL
jgi:hypothetical protein